MMAQENKRSTQFAVLSATELRLLRAHKRKQKLRCGENSKELMFYYNVAHIATTLQ